MQNIGPVLVFAPGHGKTKTEWLWTYVRDGRPCAHPLPPAVWFAFSPDCREEHRQAHLKSFHGTLQADAYAGFHPLYDGGRITEASCWAHTRREFHDILAATNSPDIEIARQTLAKQVEQLILTLAESPDGPLLRSPETRRECVAVMVARDGIVLSTGLAYL